MPQSLSNVVVHMVFSTKQRAPSLTTEVRHELFPYFTGVLRNHGCNPIALGGVEDHIHILFAISRTMTLAQVAEKVKTSSAKWIKSKWQPEFAWQTGYGAFSIGYRNVGEVSRYVREQESHHRQISFQDEFLLLLEEAGLEYDLKYIWD